MPRALGPLAGIFQRLLQAQERLHVDGRRAVARAHEAVNLRGRPVHLAQPRMIDAGAGTLNNT